MFVKMERPFILHLNKGPVLCVEIHLVHSENFFISCINFKNCYVNKNCFICLIYGS